MTEEKYMRRAIELACLASGSVCPNPHVGAVIVKEGRIIGEGYHEACGGLHAERVAIAATKEDLKGSTLYVTLEPCCHRGKQPPCTEAILEAGIARVVIGSRDPNPLVAGRGAALLRAQGLEVTEDFMREACDGINPLFFHYMATHTPYVVMKWASTLDGKIATRTGASRWISGEKSRQDVHRLRSWIPAIMVGIGTVLADDPLLTSRIEQGRNPTRIIVDSHLRIPTDSAIMKTAGDIPTLVATISRDEEKHQRLTALGATLLTTEALNGRVDLGSLMKLLGERELDGVLLEGGATLNYAALEAGIVDELLLYLAPKIFGGAEAKGAVGGRGVALPDEAFPFTFLSSETLGEDLKLRYLRRKSCSQES